MRDRVFRPRYLVSVMPTELYAPAPIFTLLMPDLARSASSSAQSRSSLTVNTRSVLIRQLSPSTPVIVAAEVAEITERKAILAVNAVSMIYKFRIEKALP